MPLPAPPPEICQHRGATAGGGRALDVPVLGLPVAGEREELVIVGGHIGFPWTLEMISLARKYPNVYIDTSAYKPSRYPPELVEYLRAGGRKKVLFGTNYPMLMPRDCIAELDALQLDAEARRRFLGENAAQVFRLEL